MACKHIDAMLEDYVAGRLADPSCANVAEHLAGCSSCREAAADLALDAALSRGLPRYAPPEGLRQQLREQLRAGAPAAMPRGFEARARARKWTVVGTIAGASLGALLVLTGLAGERRTGGDWDLVNEAVTDHLRVAVSTHPVEIESGGIHQVKPWFTGRLDFAPRIVFSGDGDFPLVGGSVGYVRDRKAAVFTFRRRLHLITLLIFPTESLRWPDGKPTHVGSLEVTERDRRGFSVLLWRGGDLGYALVSDVNRQDLEALAQRINPP